MRTSRSLAVVCSRFEDAVRSMDKDALYFSALYDNKSHIDIVSEKLKEIAEAHNKYFDGFKIQKEGDTWRLGVTVYESIQARDMAVKKGANYERCSA